MAEPRFTAGHEFVDGRCVRINWETKQPCGRLWCDVAGAQRCNIGEWGWSCWGSLTYGDYAEIEARRERLARLRSSDNRETMPEIKYIAGHQFVDGPDGCRCIRALCDETRAVCNRLWCEISGVQPEDIGKHGWAHTGILTGGEYEEIRAQVEREWKARPRG